MTIRLAQLSDLNALQDIEQQCFDSKIYHLTTRRQLRYLLTKGNAQIWVYTHEGKILGYSILLYRMRSRYGRLYSIAVHPSHQGSSIGKALFEHAEKTVRAHKELIGMSLEIREDNTRHLERYQKLDYHVYGYGVDYYPDHTSCIKLKKVFE